MTIIQVFQNSVIQNYHYMNFVTLKKRPYFFEFAVAILNWKNLEDWFLYIFQSIQLLDIILFSESRLQNHRSKELSSGGKVHN